MKRVHLATLLLLPFLTLAIAQAQVGDGIILPSEEFEDDLFGDILGDDFGDEPIVFDEPVIADEGGFEVPGPPESSENPFIGESSLPPSATTALSVVNISQNNADALETGARPGDILRYEFEIDSQSDDVKNFIAQVNVSGLESAVNFTDVGLGSLSNGLLTFPEYSQQAPCNQVYTFFVQVKEDCGEMENVLVSAEESDVRVNLNCGLTQVGPASNGFLVWGVALLLAAFGMMWVSNRRTN